MIVAIFSFSVGIKQYSQTLSYIPTYCLVKNSSLQNCGTQHTRSKSSVQQCFRGMWLVDYIDSGKWEQTTIIDSNFWVDRNHIRHQHHGLKIYEVFILESCIKALLSILNRLMGFMDVIILFISAQFNGKNQVPLHLFY
jgi:hypothetical protein